MSISIKTINDNITKAGRLENRIIGIYRSDSVPDCAVTPAKVITAGNPCIAKALYKMSKHIDVPAIYVGSDGKECCAAAPSWFGYRDFVPGTEKMFAADQPNSICLKRSTDVYFASLNDMGKITPPGKYIVMQALSDIKADMGSMRSILCIGSAMQLRNLGGLIHFSETKVYSPIIAPYGSGCSIAVTFPAGMASGCPKNAAILGPMVPEGNRWLPRDTMMLGIPIEVAVRMAEGYESSFAVKQPGIAYPDSTEEI